MVGCRLLGCELGSKLYKALSLAESEDLELQTTITTTSTAINMSSPKSEKLPQFLNGTPLSKSRSNRLVPAVVLLSVLLSLPIFLFFHYTWHHSQHAINPSSPPAHFLHDHHHHSSYDAQLPKLGDLIPSKDTLKGGTIMPKMGNATAKAELGRATWKVPQTDLIIFLLMVKFMHTMTARFPEKPTADEREALKAFIYLFSRFVAFPISLYPCGDCARHFQELLKRYPPQVSPTSLYLLTTSSRNVASLHLCSLHNLVNERLGKPEYNCTSLLENYDCGCGHDEKDAKKDDKSSFLNSVPLMSPAF
ncbi:uncharacterized protein VP01_91g10 [Puccinia sorghi]|uniref:Sulfhydryl oxidase n=1 Tax=Puccinia sorghi TaxID=27349 RepID=A0A0L6U7C4_9BASI|nr:uncharacterized protein VP01_91g10 [Puccinia sorghi]